MKPFCFFLSLILFAASARTAEGAGASAPPEQVLKELVARGRTLMDEAARDKSGFDQENFHTQMQQLADAYEALLKQAPDFAPAYVAYALMLDKIDMRKQSAILLLRANHLDQNLPIVKNQLGRYLAEEGKPLDAMPYFLSAVELAPKEPLYHYQLGILIAEARDDFLQSGEWTRTQLDKTMIEALNRAAELAPDNIPYAYRAAEAYYDLAAPRWDDALAAWRALETRVKPGIGQQTLRLQEANILLKQEKIAEARALLDTVSEPVLAKNKQTLIDQLPKTAEK